MTTWLENVRNVAQIVSPVLTVVAVYLAYRLGTRQLRRQKKVDLYASLMESRRAIFAEIPDAEEAAEFNRGLNRAFAIFGDSPKVMDALSDVVHEQDKDAAVIRLLRAMALDVGGRPPDAAMIKTTLDVIVATTATAQTVTFMSADL